jgi:predicted transcriptional regulator
MKKKSAQEHERDEKRIAHTVPESDKWLYDNPTALASVRKGLADAAAGRTVSLGSFAKYLDSNKSGK